MSDAAGARTDRELQMLEKLVDCAFALGESFGEAAKAEPDRTAKLDLFDAFNRSFLAVRMGIRLSMALRAPPKPAAAPRPERLDRLDVERNDCDTTPERLEAERERDRDYEPVSLPRFLATLGLVAADAERLKPPVPANTLPTLHGLLAQTKASPVEAPVSTPNAGLALLTRPPTVAPKASLLNSAARPPDVPRPPRRWSG